MLRTISLTLFISGYILQMADELTCISALDTAGSVAAIINICMLIFNVLDKVYPDLLKKVVGKIKGKST